MQEQTAGCCKL